MKRELAEGQEAPVKVRQKHKQRRLIDSQIDNLDKTRKNTEE